MAELIAVLSGKGGTGKTSLCAGLGTALAVQGKKILCVDCDIGLRNLDIALGLSQESTLAFTEVFDGRYPLEKATVHPVYPTLHFLTAPMNCPAEQVDPAAFSRLLQQTRQQFDYVLLDAPAGIETGFSLAARFADRVILVTGPDPAAVRDAARAGQILEQMGKGDVRLIVNRITPKMAAQLGITVDDIMDRAGLPLLGVVPEDRNVTLAAAFSQPLLGYARGGAAAACRRIARRLRGLNVTIKI